MASKPEPPNFGPSWRDLSLLFMGIELEASSVLIIDAMIGLKTMVTERKSSTTGVALQFLREACNKHGRVAGHNNMLAISLEADGLVLRNHRGIEGQSNFLITEDGRLFLEAQQDARP